MKSPMEASESSAETAMPTIAPAHEGDRGPVRDELHPEQRLDAQHLEPPAPDDADHDRTHDRDRREHRDRDAEAHGDRKAANRTGAEHEQKRGRDQRGEVRIHDRGESALEAEIEGGEGARALARLLPDAFVDQDVCVDRKTDPQHDPGDAGQGQRRPEKAQRAEGQDHVQGEREVGDEPPRSIENEHKAEDQDEAGETGIHAHLDRVAAEVGADGALLDDGEWRRQRARAQQGREVCRLLDGEVAADLACAAGDRLPNDRRAQDFAVEHDGERIADILPP